jgi:hypothetical protein
MNRYDDNTSPRPSLIENSFKTPELLQSSSSLFPTPPSDSDDSYQKYQIDMLNGMLNSF